MKPFLMPCFLLLFILASQALHAQESPRTGLLILDPVKAMARLKSESAPPGRYWPLLDASSREFTALHPELLEAFLARFPTPADLAPVDFEPDGPSFLVETTNGLFIRVVPDATTGDYRINLTR